MALNESRRQQLDAIVQHMVANKESDSNIQFVVDDFKKKYANEQSSVAAQNYNQNRGAAQKTAGFLGIEKAGQATASALNPQSFQPSPNLQVKPEQLIQKASTLPAGSPERRKLAQAAAQQSGLTSEATGRNNGTPVLPQEVDPGLGLSNKEVAGSFGNVAVNVATAGLPGPKATSAIGRIGQSVASNAAVAGIGGVTQALNDNKSGSDIAKAGAQNLAAGGILGGLTQGGGELFKLLTSPHVTEGLYNKAIGVPSKVVEAGRSPAKRLINEGVVGSQKGILQRADQTIAQSESQLQKILNTPGTVKSHQTSDVLGQIQHNIQGQYLSSLDAKDVAKLVDNLPLASLRGRNTISVSALNDLRREIDNKFLGNAKWLNDAPTERITALKTAANTLRDLVQQSDSRLPAIFSQYSDALTTKRALTKELARPHILTNLLELIGSGALGVAGGGLSPSGMAKAAAAYGVTKAVTSTPARTGAAVGLDRLGKAVAKPALQAVKVPARLGSQAALRNATK